MVATALLRFGDGLVARCRPGTKGTILWFHGSAMDSSVWENLWESLPGWQHLGLDLPGHGESRDIGPDETLASLGRTVSRLAAEHRVEHLAGLSFGTILAIEVAMQAPGTFGTVILGSPALAGGPHDEDVERRYEDLARLYAERGHGPHLAQLWMRAPPDLFRGAQREPLLWLQLFWLATRHRWTELADGSMLRLTQPAQEPSRLGVVSAPVLVVVGADDLPASRRSADLVCASLPDCHRSDMADAGHLCLLERPVEAAGIIEAHLAANGRRPPSRYPSA